MHTLKIMTGKKSFSLNEECSLVKAHDKVPINSHRDAAAKLDVSQATSCGLQSENKKEISTVCTRGDRKHTGKAPLPSFNWIDNVRVA